MYVAGALSHHHGGSTASNHLCTIQDEQNLRSDSSSDARSLDGASGPSALSDHITCLRQKHLRRHGDDVITSGDHVTSNGARQPEADGRCVNAER